MTGKKKGPKIAWRDLMKGGAASEGEAATPASEPAAAPTPEAASTAPTAPAAPAPEAASASVGGPPPEISVAPDAAAPTTTRAPEASPRRGRRKAEAPASPAPDTLAADTTPDGSLPAALEPSAIAYLAGSVEAPAASAAPVADEPAAEPSPEPAREQSADEQVRALLDRLARRPLPPPVPQAIPVAEVAAERAPADAPDAEEARRPAGPRVDGPEVQPLVPLAGLRDAARARRGRVELLLFRVGGEFFAVPLGAVEEALESPAIHTLPEMPASMLGVVRLRERLVPTYTPSGVLGVSCADAAAAALLVRAGERRVALAVDDVEDVMELDLATLREPPLVEDLDGVLLGVARHGRELVGVLDADALIAACLGGLTPETP